MFTLDDDNAVIRIYHDNIPGLCPNAKERILKALWWDLGVVRSYLSRLTGANWRIEEVV